MSMPLSPPAYAELHCHSYFSLLDGASAPEILAEEAHRLGLAALALTDHDSLAGAVRFSQAARRIDLHPIFGAEITLEDQTHLTLLVETQDGYANLCRLITAARLEQMPPTSEVTEPASESAELEHWPGKLAPRLPWSTLARHTRGIIALSGCRAGPVAAPLRQGDDDAARAAAMRLRDLFGPHQLYMELQHHNHPGDTHQVHALATLAQEFDLPLVATNNVHYATRDFAPLRDALHAIRDNTTLAQLHAAGGFPLNRTACLCSPAEMARRFAAWPTALTNTLEIAQRCQVTLDFSDRRLPTFPVPAGKDEFTYLYELCHANLPHRYPHLRPQVLKQLAHELDVIERAGLAGYFLIVWDIMRFAQSAGIRGQGRGSAANSIVAHLLDISSIDPLQHNLLFERFLSADRFTTPDIDLDFDAGRRDEVIQYVYRRYGRAHAAMVCNVVTYQARSALRDLAKVLDFPPPTIERLIRTIDTHSATHAADTVETQINDETCHETRDKAGDQSAPDRHPLRLLAQLMRQIDGCPRHLSIHAGGMLITGPRLDEIVPLEPATMPGRFVCQWDKDSAEDAGLIKIDLLGLRMLGLLAVALESIQTHGEPVPDLDNLPLDDPAVYARLQQGDTIGTFQVESRAQQQMLPRHRPTRFEDIIVQIAIIRPGPIQGNMVHPYLKRRWGQEPVTYMHPLLEPVLAETLGVLLFQEQVLRVAVALAGFSPGEADLLRRALSRSRPGPELDSLRQRFITGAASQQIDAATADAVFTQLAGYAGYGFCKSHSAAFALIAYQSLWLKEYYPAHFYAALLNQQPMGFYSSEVITGDAARHGVDLLPPHIHHSAWQFTLETTPRGSYALRTGLGRIKALGEAAYARLADARAQGPFVDLRDFCRRTCLPVDVVSNLIRAGALDEFGPRRELLWTLGMLDYRSDVTDPTGFDLTLPVPAMELPQLTPLEQTIWDYELMGLSPDGQVLQHYRTELRRAGVLSTWEVKRSTAAGKRVHVGGMVVVRQRPGTAKGIMFLSLEDESGLLDLVVKPPVYPQVRPVLQNSMLVVATGIVQKAEGATSVLVEHIQRLA